MERWQKRALTLVATAVLIAASMAWAYQERHHGLFQIALKSDPEAVNLVVNRVGEVLPMCMGCVVPNTVVESAVVRVRNTTAGPDILVAAGAGVGRCCTETAIALEIAPGSASLGRGVVFVVLDIEFWQFELGHRRHYEAWVAVDGQATDVAYIPSDPCKSADIALGCVG